MKAVLHHLGGSGPPLLMIHGFGADRMTWMFLSPLLTDRFSVYAVDLPGHGEASNDVGDGTIEALATSVATILPEPPMRMIGHSMGGAVILELARRGLVSDAVLIAPAGLGASVSAQFLTGFPEIETHDDARRVLGLLVSNKRLVTAQMAQYVISGLATDGRRAALRKIANGLGSVDPTIPDDLPLTMIWGDADAVNLPPSSLPVPDFHLLEGVGHLPHAEAVSKMAPIVLNALNG